MIKITKSEKLIVRILFSVLFISSIPIHSIYADTRYISDTLVVNLRDKPSPQYTTIQRLITNEAVELLEQYGNYLKVRTKEGKEGWVESQYLSTKIPKPSIILGLKKEIKKFQEEIAFLKESQTELKNHLDITLLNAQENEKKAKVYQEESSRAMEHLTKITEKYNTLINQSKNVVKLIEKNDKLTKDNKQLTKEIDHLTQNISSLKRVGFFWLLVTASGMFVAGLFTGKIAARRKKKKFYYSENLK
ncbi:MAG: TIGR04211 family SH3 domain-containing protein [Thermodesulfobacteriota bacterium]|nr:TIGR04211 family SH3 domain-containing protein [Thermodesulfobacteriota bacterium]